MIQRIAGLLALTALVGPVACLDDEGPPNFTTKGTCQGGETKPCGCEGPEDGIRVCSSSGSFGECACPGCTVLPDCDECGSDCLERCLCESGRIDLYKCRDLCGVSDGGNP